jgi:glycerol uptake facilitator-like aquaporin
MNLARRLVAEGLGTALLLAAVIGSGIMGERLAQGNTAVALLANTLATGAALVVLITVFSPVSGAHFNPLVTLTEWHSGRMRLHEALGYLGAQFTGAILGVAAAHLMFDEPLFVASQQARTGLGQWWSEFVASFGLLMTILGTGRSRPAFVPVAVGGYIAAAYWFTASTSFANPAVTLARSLTDSFAGIRPADVPGFVLAQLAGAAAAALLIRWLYAPRHSSSMR